MPRWIILPLYSCITLATILLLMMPRLLSGQELTTAPQIKPDPDIQRLLEALLKYKWPDDKEARDAMKSVRELTFKTPEVLVAQVLYFSLHSKAAKGDWGWFGLQVKLASESGDFVQRGVIPFLESKDDALRKEAQNWLLMVDGARADR